MDQRPGARGMRCLGALPCSFADLKNRPATRPQRQVIRRPDMREALPISLVDIVLIKVTLNRVLRRLATADVAELLRAPTRDQRDAPPWQ